MRVLTQQKHDIQSMEYRLPAKSLSEPDNSGKTKIYGSDIDYDSARLFIRNVPVRLGSVLGAIIAQLLTAKNCPAGLRTNEQKKTCSVNITLRLKNAITI